MSPHEADREAARRRLPSPIFHFIDGGAEEEWSLADSRESFGRIRFEPRVLTGARAQDLSTRVMGCDLAMPLLLAPATGLNMVRHDGERNVAQAAAEAGITYVPPLLSACALEAFPAVNPGRSVLQLYLPKDRAVTEALLERCQRAGYAGVCLTVDAPVGGNRERDLATGMAMPLPSRPSIALSVLKRPLWWLDMTRGEPIGFANLPASSAGPKRSVTVAENIARQFHNAPTWEDLAWLRRHWSGALALKGVLAPDDARKAIDHGVDCLFLSNHGGRQLDGAIAPMDALAGIRAAVGPRVELIVDGGVRRGSDVVKALALGATACSIGRPYIFALARDGRRGVADLLSRMRAEIERSLILLGCRDLSELTADFLILASEGARR